MRNKVINILAIDDNLDNLIILQALTFEAFPNAKMTMALSGREGLDLAIAEKPDVILLDIVMPVMDGYEVCREIKTNPLLADIPVIFITALKGDKESRIRSLEVGGDAFLAKPIDESELVAQISAMVKINIANKEKKSENIRLGVLVAEKTEEINQTHNATLNLLEDLRAEIETRKETENSLRESEEKFRDTADFLPQIIFELLLDGTITYVNKQAEKQFGYKTEELIGQKNSLIHLPEEYERAGESIRRKLKGEIIQNKEFTLVRKDKSMFPGLFYINPIIKADKIIGVRGIIIDMTEQKQAENALRESEALYKAIIEASPDNIIITDTSGNIEIISSSSLKNFQYDNEDQIIGKNIASFIDKSDINKMQNDFAYMLKGIKTGPNEYKSFRSDKSVINIEVNGGLIKDLDGKISKLVFVSRDITERKISEKALESSQQELQTIYDNAPVMMALIDEERRILFANKAFASMTEMTKDIIANSKIGGVNGCLYSFENELGCGYGDECKNCELRTSIDQTFETGNGFKNIDYTFSYTSHNRIIEKKLIGSTAIIQHENQKNVLLCFHDISDRKKAEDALQKSESLLRSFIDNSPFEIWARDIDKIGILENRKYVDSHKSILGVSLDKENMSPYELNKSNRVNETVFKGETVDNEIEFKIKDEYRIFQQIIFPIRNLTKIIGIAGFNIDITERKKAEKALGESQVQLKNFAAHLQNIREEERILLAREIHDDLGQILVAMKIDMGFMKQSIMKSKVDIDPSKLLVEFEKLIQLVDTTIKTTRRIMTNLRPEVLDMLGFIEAIKQYLKGYEERHKVKCTLINNSTDIDLNPQQAVALYRIIQEALNNVAKHAKASQVNVRIIKEAKKLTLEVIDNGMGFDTTSKKRSDSYGLIGMKERIFLLDGNLEITSKLRKGTTVKVVINI